MKMLFLLTIVINVGGSLLAVKEFHRSHALNEDSLEMLGKAQSLNNQSDAALQKALAMHELAKQLCPTVATGGAQ